MSKLRESSHDPDGLDILDPYSTDLPKKPNWINLAQLDSPIDDNLVNNLLYKPALRYHGITSGLWGLGLSRAPSLVSDSRPPSYRFSESIHSKLNADACSTCDRGSVYNKQNLSGLAPVPLRRRNTIAVILVLVGLLAAVASITGIILHSMHPKALLRGHVRFTIANENFTASMMNMSSDEFKSISRSLCSEMDLYYLTSELSDFYLGCRLIALRNDTEKHGISVHYTIDFKENPTTKDKDRIKDVILRKSGRQTSDANLFFVVKDYLVYLKSLQVELGKVPLSNDPPGYNRPIIPWRDDIDFISRKSIHEGNLPYANTKQLTDANRNTIITSNADINDMDTNTNNKTALKHILPNALDPLLLFLNRTALYVQNNDTNSVNVSVSYNHALTASVFGTSSLINIPIHRNIAGVEHVHEHPSVFEPPPSSLFITSNELIALEGARQGRIFKHGRLISDEDQLIHNNVRHAKISLEPTQTRLGMVTTNVRDFLLEPNSHHGGALFEDTIQPTNEMNGIGHKVILTKTLSVVPHMSSSNIHVLEKKTNPIVQQKEGLPSANASLERLNKIQQRYHNVNPTATSLFKPFHETTQMHRFQNGPDLQNKRQDLTGMNLKHPESHRHLHHPINVSAETVSTRISSTTERSNPPSDIHVQVNKRTTSPRHVQHLGLIRDIDSQITPTTTIGRTDATVNIQDQLDDALIQKQERRFTENRFDSNTDHHLHQTLSRHLQTGDQRPIHAVNHAEHHDHIGNHHDHMNDGKRVESNINQIHASLQTSFQVPAESFHDMTETSVAEIKTVNRVIKGSSKIMTISKDAFIIMGQSSTNYMDDSLIRPTKSLFAVPEKTVTEITLQRRGDTTPNSHTNTVQSKHTPTELSHTLRINDTPLDIGKSFLNETPLTIQHSKETPVNGMEMQEVVVHKPVRTSIDRLDDNVGWVNIFNVPRQTVNVHVGEVIKPKTSSASVETVFGNPLNEKQNVSDTVSFAIRDLLPNLKNMLQQWPILRPTDAVDIHEAKSDIPDGDQLHRKVHHIPTFEHTPKHDHAHTDHETHIQEHIIQNKNDFFNDDLNDPRYQHPNFRIHTTEHDHSDGTKQRVGEQDDNEQHNDDHDHQQESVTDMVVEGQGHVSTNVDTMQNNGRAIWGNSINRRPSASRTLSDNQRLPMRHQFDSDVQTETTLRHRFPMRSLNRRLHWPWQRINNVRVGGTGLRSIVTTSEQLPRNVLIQRDRIQWQFPVPDSDERLRNDQNANLIPRNIQQLESVTDDNFTTQDELRQDDVVDNYRPTIWPLFATARIIRETDRYPMALTHSERQPTSILHGHRMWRNNIFGIPVSTDFDDIEDIKFILKGIIKSLFNMTEKIDNMQGAIDFINNTLHEENRPIFRLEGTLNNMSFSLDNLKLNLNSIIKTLDGFKHFLKQFDNTVFDVDDVIKHLDETIDNLNRTAVFVGSSLDELNVTANAVDDVMIKGNASLVHLNNSAFDVGKTTNFANKTLDSMRNTLHSLEDAVDGLNIKVSEVLGGIDGINVSLKNINDSVQNSYKRIKQIGRKMNVMNSSVDSIEQTVVRLNRTYNDINKALGEMNETFAFINGTALDVIRHLKYTDGKLLKISNNIGSMSDGMLSMNSSLHDTIDWMSGMMKTLNDFNSNLEKQNNTIIVNLQNTDLIETLSTLLSMNNTLFEFGNKVDHINNKLDNMDTALIGLESNLDQLQDTLANINITFRQLNSTIETTNTTFKYITKALGHINDSIDSMSNQSNDLTSIFGSINKTLDAVNATILKVNQTAQDVKRGALEVNATLQTKANRIDQIKRLAVEVVDSLKNSSGSLPDLNNQLYNTNESLRVIHGKQGIVGESYDILEDTLNGILKTVDKLFARVNETDSTLRRVNVSFADVDISMLTMEQTIRDWDERLNKLTKSFKGMNDSMTDIGTAFPNLMENMKGLHQSITYLQGQIKEQSNELMKQNSTKNKSGNRYQHLKEKAKEIRQILIETKELIQNVKDFSAKVDQDILDMKEYTTVADNMYANFEMNLKLLKETLLPMQIRYDDIKNTSEHRQNSLKQVNDTVTSHLHRFRTLKNSTNGYKNVHIPFYEMQQNLTSAIDIVGTLKEDITTSENELSIEVSHVWNKQKEPLGTELPNKDLSQRIKLLNTSMNSVDDLMSKANDKLNHIIEHNSNMEKMFSDIRLAMKMVDDIEDMSNATNNSIRNLEIIIGRKVNEADVMSKKLTNLEERLLDMKLQYGTINGTHNNSNEDFIDLENRLVKARDGVKNTVNQLNAIRTTYLDVVNNVDQITGKYKQDVFSPDAESLEKLKDYVAFLEDNNGTLHGISLNLQNITDTAAKTDEYVNAIDDMFKSFESELSDKKDSHNFIKQKKPTINKRFNKLDVQLQNVNGTVDFLYSRIDHLQTEMDLIRNRSEFFPNIYIDLHSEYEILDKEHNAINTLRINISKLHNDVLNAKDWFYDLTISNSTFEEVRDSYISLRNFINKLDENTDTLSVKGKIVEGNLQVVGDELSKLSKLLDHFNTSHIAAASLYERIKELQRTDVVVDTNLKEAFDLFNKLETNLLKIQNNYTNFTATNVDLSESLIHETIAGMKDTISNLTELSYFSDDLLAKIVNNQSSLQNTMNLTTFNRTSTMGILDNIVSKYIFEMNKDADKLNATLDHINSKIKSLNITIKGVNETLHATDRQLFIDRQKKLLADSKFPDLEYEHNRLNNSLGDLTNLLQKLGGNVSNMMQDFLGLDDRLGQYPNLNISTKDLYETLKNLTHFVSSGGARINETLNNLTRVQNVMWVKDGQRYMENETIAHMKHRYDIALDEMKNINDVIENINDNIIWTRNEANKVHGDIVSLNNTLDVYDELDAKYTNVTKRFKRISESLSDANSESTRLGTQLGDIFKGFADLTNRYKHINGSVFNYSTGKLEQNLLNAKESYSVATGSLNEINNTMHTLQDMVTAIQNIRDTMVSNKTSLEDINTRMNELLVKTTKRFSQLDVMLERHTNESTYVRENVIALDDEMDNVQQDLLRQEKRIFYENNSPLSSFRHVKTLIKNSLDTRNLVEENLNKTFENYFNVKLRLDKIPHIDIPVVDVVNALENTNETLSNHGNTHADMTKKHEHIKSMLVAPDGNPYSDNETIEEMKERYNAVKMGLESIVNHINNINKSLDSIVRNALPSNNNVLGKINASLDVYDRAVDDLHALKMSIGKLNDNQTGELTLNEERQNQLNQTILNMDTLKMRFENVTNKEIEDLKSMLRSYILDNVNNFEKISQSTKRISFDIERINNTIANYIHMSNQNFTSIDELQDVLSSFTNFDKNTLFEIKQLSNETIVKKEEGVAFDDDLLKLQNVIDDLQTLFENEQKMTYVAKMLNIVGDTFANVSQDLHDSSRYATHLQEDVEDTKYNVQRVTHVLSDIPTSNISTEKEMADTTKSIVSIKESNDTIQKINTTLVNVMHDLKIMNTTDFVMNNTFDDIKNRFLNLSRTINMAKEKITSVSVNLSNTEDSNTRIKQYIYDIENESHKMKRLNKEVLKLNNELDNKELINENLNVYQKALQEKLEQLYANASEIGLLYQNVNKTDLWDAFNDINETLNNKTIKFSELKNQQIFLDAYIGENTDRVQEMVKLFNNSIFSLNDLKRVNKVITSNMSLANMLMENINATTALQDLSQRSLMENINKTSIKLQELETKFKDQQMEDYIAERFPEIMDISKHVNDTLHAIHDRTLETGSNVEDLYFKLSDINSVVSNHPVIDISLLSNKENYSIVANGYKNIISKNKTFTELFKNLSSSMSRRVGETDSLITIKSRLDNYNKMLQNLLSEIANLNKTLDETNHDTSLQHNNLNVIGEEVQRFDRIRNDTDLLLSSMAKIKQDLQQRGHQLAVQNRRVGELQEEISYINETFKNVKDPNLLSQVELLTRKVKDVKQQMENVTAELNGFNQSLNDYNTTVVDILETLGQPVSELSVLTSLIDNVRENISTIKRDVNGTVDKYLIDRSKDLHNRSLEIEDLDVEIKDLYDKFIETNKKQYLKSILPLLLESYKHLYDNISLIDIKIKRTAQNIIQTNDTLTAFTSNVSSHLNIDFNTTNLHIDVDIADHDASDNFDAFVEQRNLFDKIDGLVFTEEYWNNRSIKEIKERLNTIKVQFSELEMNVTSITHYDKQINDDIEAVKSEMSYMKEVIEKYNRLKGTSAKQGNTLNDFANILNNTEKILNEITSSYKFQNELFSNLTSFYPNITNDNIERIKTSVVTILSDTVGLRLPLTEKLFQTRMLDKFNTATDIQGTNTQRLDEIHASHIELDRLLNETGKSISEISTHIDEMEHTNMNFNQQGIQLKSNLENSETMLMKLEQSLKSAEKDRFLTEMIPKITSLYDRVSELLRNSSVNIRDTDMAVNESESLLQNVTSSIKEHENVNISNSDIQKRILDNNVILQEIKDKYTRNINSMVSLSPKHLNKSEILHNTTIDIIDLKVLLKQLESDVIRVQNETVSTNDELLDMKQIHEGLVFDLQQLNRSLTMFKGVKQDLNATKEYLHKVNENSDDILPVLNSSVEKLLALNASLQYLHERYNDHTFNSTFAVKLLTDAKNDLDNLTRRQADINRLLSEADNEIKYLELNVTSTIGNSILLNETNAFALDSLPKTKSKLETVQKLLDDVKERIPDLNVTLTSFEIEIIEINKTLHNEDNKQSFSDNTLPKLQARYQNINFTFEMTNKSLQSMQENIAKMEEHIRYVKFNMNKFENINISMSDIDSNVTHMEEGLAIMQAHYDNVKDVIQNLQKGLKNNDIFGKDVSLGDAKLLYGNFSHTLDDIEHVLRKIDVEITNMDDHLMFINDTVISIDAALVDFEIQGNKSKEIKSDMGSVDAALNKTNTDIGELAMTLENLNSSFLTMQTVYKDVIGTTTENNTQFANEMGDLQTELNNIKQSAHGLLNEYMRSSDLFDQMNQELFQNVSTHKGLNETLSEVKVTFTNLSLSLDTLANKIDETRGSYNSLNSSLANLGDVLTRLNDTLHKEQIKYNFLASNFGGLQTKTQNVQNVLAEAEKYITNVKDTVENGNTTYEKLKLSLNSHNNLNISLYGTDSAIGKAFQTIKGTELNHTSIKDMFNKLMNNITSAKDSSGRISDIKRKYDALNQTLDDMKNDLESMNGNLEETQNKTRDVDNYSKDLIRSIEAFENVLFNANQSGSTVKNVSLQLTYPRDILNQNNGDISTLEKDAREMLGTYSYVDDLMSKENLTSIIQELASQKENLKALKRRHFGLSEQMSEASNLSNEVQHRLQSNINSKFELDMAVANSSDMLNHVSELSSNITLDNTMLVKDSLIVQSRIRDLENKLQVLNETLYEEKMKIDFVKQNFPDAETRYNILSQDIQKSDVELRNTSNNFEKFNESLTYLTKMVDTITAIDIPLDVEKQVAEDIKAEIADLKNMQENITEEYNRLNVTNLQDRQRSFADLKGEYNHFGNTAVKLGNDISSLGDRLKLLQNRLLGLNMTVQEVNTTLDKFANTNTKATSFFEKVKRANDIFTNSSHQLKTMGDSLHILNKTLHDIMANFSDVNDPLLLKAKESIQKLLTDTMQKVSDLKKNTDTISGLNNKTRQNANSLNDTISKTKFDIGGLQTDISVAEGTMKNLSSLLDRMDDQQIVANNSSVKLNPDITSIETQLEQLQMSFQKEQTKLNFIKDQKPTLKMLFKGLSLPLDETNKRISQTEVNLADLRFSIKSVGERLDRFAPIDISTKPELKKWQNLSELIKDDSTKFMNLSKVYNTLKADMNNLDDKNKDINDMQAYYQDINKTINTISNGLSAINTSLDVTDKQSRKIDDNMKRFIKVMDDFRAVQNQMKTLQTESSNISKDSGKIKRKLARVDDGVSLLKDSVDEMQTKYKVLSDKVWLQRKPRFKTTISNLNSSILSSAKKSNNLNASFNKTVLKISNGLKTLQNTGLTRVNAESVIEQVNRTASKASSELKDVKQSFLKVNNAMSTMSDKVANTKADLGKLNRTLNVQLQKLVFVNTTLPVLQSKHTRVNATFNANIPDVRNLQAQIDDVVSVITKIKEKMRIFSQQDTDKSVQNWDTSIDTLNKTVQSIIKQNQQTSVKLSELKKNLWKKTPMYTKIESLKVVQDRFSGYNKSLEDIIAAVHKIKIKLTQLDNTSQELGVSLMDHDEMLTTTPEPLGPPLWLQFESTDKGIIGKDSGYVECSAGDLTDWDVMKITRQRDNAKEENIAAWKLGTGARKAIRDRRITLKKTQNATGGALRVNIKSLQCEDEASYYCSVDTYHKYPLRTNIAVITPPEDSLSPDFPTEVFEDKIANFSCTGHPGYPGGSLSWKIKRPNDKDFKYFNFYSAKKKVSDASCIRTVTNTVEYSFNMTWNNTKVRCSIDNTTFYAEGIIRLLPYDICNKVRYLGTIRHPYTPHKYIVCGKELNIMQCPGNTCYDRNRENCIQCTAGQQSSDPCHGKPMFTYVAHETDCRKYYICMGPTKTVKKCTKGYFHPNALGKCALSYSQSYCAQRSG